MKSVSASLNRMLSSSSTITWSGYGCRSLLMQAIKKRSSSLHAMMYAVRETSRYREKKTFFFTPYNND